jgi:GNAT superfamily N-acetyltransferase
MDNSKTDTKTLNFKLINKNSGEDLEYPNRRIADFLYDHLDEYGDKKEHIMNALEYVFNPVRGGNILIGIVDREIVGAVVLNETGMKGYIPGTILVYIAVHSDHRGQGFGKVLMKNAIKVTHGSIALHVEPDNPARHLYEKLGFTSRYLEMRLNR